MKMPERIMASPASVNGAMGSCRNTNTHTSDKNGVTYARLEILAVLPLPSASAQQTLPAASVKTPFHAKPSRDGSVIDQSASAVKAIAPLSRKVANIETIMETVVSYGNFLLKAVNAP